MASRLVGVLALVATIFTLTHGAHLPCGEHEKLPELSNWIGNVGERTGWHDALDLPAAIAGHGVDGRWASFERPMPNMLDRSFLDRANDTFNHDQSFVPPSKCADEHCNAFVLEGGPFVVALDNAYVGHDGLVFDSSYVYPTRGSRKWHEPHWQQKEEADRAAAKGLDHAHKPLNAASTVICVDKLVTILQPYQENYYHFVAESLPRLIMAKDIMLQDPSVRLLTRTKPFVVQFLAKLGIPADRIETLGHGEFIHANTLYVPTPTKIFSPSQENLLALRQHFPAYAPVQAPRNLVVYASREGAWSRDVTNERHLLEAMRALLSKTDLELAVFDGSSLGVEETISLFQRAVMVVGPHGAGLTNMLWTREGTKVVEFLHMSYPLLCYWHMASALGLEYWMLPVPESSWAANMVVPVQEVLDIMLAALKPHFSHETHHEDDDDDDDGAIMDPVVVEPCAPGTATDVAGGGCTACPPGTFSYHPDSEVCTACVAGQFASGSGNTYCSMCPPGSYSAEASVSACTECPPVTGPLEPNTQVVWGSKSQGTCPAELRSDDARFIGSYSYAAYATYATYATYPTAENSIIGNDQEEVVAGADRPTSMFTAAHWMVDLFASLLDS